MNRCLYGPAPATFAVGDLAPTEAILFDYQGRQSLTLAPDSAWSNVLAQLPDAWRPEFLVLDYRETDLRRAQWDLGSVVRRPGIARRSESPLVPGWG
jgi:hypothetical protein